MGICKYCKQELGNNDEAENHAGSCVIMNSDPDDSFSFNPHWIGNSHCRDYKFGNVIVRNIPDSYVMRITKFRGGYGFAKGNVDEFLDRGLDIDFNPTGQTE